MKLPEKLNIVTVEEWMRKNPIDKGRFNDILKKELLKVKK